MKIFSFIKRNIGLAFCMSTFSSLLINMCLQSMENSANAYALSIFVLLTVLPVTWGIKEGII